MNVYVESNFVLEQALEQEQCESCEQLVKVASTGSIRLVIPAFSLAEPHIALQRKGNERSRLSLELQKHLSELGRSKPYREAPGSFSELAAVLIRSAERERAGLERAVDGMLKAAEVIPLDSDIFHRANAFQSALDMSAQDAIVLASVVAHLSETEPAESCFLNRNSKDFDDPLVRELLDSFRCKFFARFDDGLSYIKARLRLEGP
ncbi:MAG TPA: PIN domain-containing protein [Bryobacteraceae bacterium]|nr:PIN domain-containing protein [Bryobacteraceae bacterium]